MDRLHVTDRDEIGEDDVLREAVREGRIDALD
jgi:glycine betaine/choline ABC-type transport system substrate-binding protein